MTDNKVIYTDPLQVATPTMTSPNSHARIEATSWVERMMRFHQLIKLRHLTHSKQYVKECQHLTQLGNGDETTNLVVEACVNPSTGEVIPPLGRAAAFIPVNLPIITAMLVTRPTVFNLVFWQWVNQTYNALFNYSNGSRQSSDSVDLKREVGGEIDTGTDAGTCHRSDISGISEKPPTDYCQIMKCLKKAMEKEENKTILTSYCGAVTASVGLAVGMTQGIKRAKVSPSTRRALQSLVPFTAVATSGIANVALMRQGELQTGIPVYSPYGDKMGMSKKAASTAITETAITRALLPLPYLILPPLVLNMLFKIPLFTSSKLIKNVTQLNVIALGVWLGLPAAIALFPQQRTLPVQEMEEHVKQWRDPQEREIEMVVFNRGL
eukprot:GHVN01017754.1.p1 GENE.GHVN01017754.1~~GHVN01017754.1.p1  ORF type:complete len:381 (+),score=72.61 GHVN01017754.1:56-1198(+)